MNSQMKRYIGQGLGGSPAQELLSPWNWGASLSQNVDVLTTWKLSEPHTTGILWSFIRQT